MNNKVIPFLTFVLGAAAGSFVTWHYLKDVYEQIAQEEIDSVKEVFLKRERELSEDEEPKRKIAACYENGESKAVVDKKEIRRRRPKRKSRNMRKEYRKRAIQIIRMWLPEKRR